MAVVINKPLVDDREYRNFKLPNGLEVLLVHDSTTDKAAAALDVGVGSFADPHDLPGLAHFLEHLLFMGTKKYPSENEYSQFLTDHAGMFNAYTAAEHTNYHFEVSWPHLKDCLDRFAQFFIEPLFSESCKSREILAVDSENKKNLQNDVWRLYQLEKNMSNPDHPVHRFTTGSYETLGKIPEEQGIDVRARLIDFYKRHYTASIMKLVIIGRDSLDAMESWAHEMFSAVPNTHPELENAPPAYIDTPTLRSEDLGVLIKAKPVMDLKLLEITFPIPDQQPLHETQPYHYYVHLLGHESKGSLLYYLKEKRWATELGCAISHICKGTDYLFVNVELTNDGMEHWHDIIEACFAYIDMVKRAGPQKWIFDEIKSTSRAAFLYRQKSKAMPLSSSLAQVLHRPIPRERLLDYSVAHTYDEDLIRNFAQYLSRDNMRAVIASQSLENLSRREKWYGTEYDVSNIPKIAELSLPALHLPEKNEFLPSNFDLVKEESTVGGPATRQNRPRMLLNTERIRIWHKLDDTFRIPKAHAFLKLIRGDVSRSPRSMRLADLFAAMINDILADYAYYADIADVSHSLATIQDGFEIEVHGFSEKLDHLLEVVLKTFCTGELREERFSVVKEQQERQLSNLMWAQPASQRALQSNFLLVEHMYSIQDRLLALKTIEFKDVLEFAAQLRREGAGIEMLVIGNMNTTKTLSISQMVQRIVPDIDAGAQTDKNGQNPRFWNQVDHPRNSSFLYDSGKHYYREIKLADPHNTNSAILVGYQFGAVDTGNSAVLSIISQILKEASFNQLRTKEQLGYIAGSNKRQLRGTLWFEVFVQSEESSQYLEERVENFVQNVARPLIANMTEEEFKKNVDSTVHEQLEKNKNLNDEAERYWGAINGGYYDFYRRQNLAGAAKTVTKAQVLAAFDKYVINESSRSKFSLHLQAQAIPQIQPETALSRAVGQLITEQSIEVTPQQIQQFMQECTGLTPEQAMKLLTDKLVSDAGLDADRAQKFVAEAVARSQEIIENAGKKKTAKPIGTPIESLKEYYSSIKLAPAPAPVQNLGNFADYEDGEAKL